MSDEWAYDEAVGWYDTEDDPATMQEAALLDELRRMRDQVAKYRLALELADDIVMTSVNVYRATAAPITANYVQRLKTAEANWGAAVRRYLSAQGLDPHGGGLPTGPRLELGVRGSAVAAAPHDGADAVLGQHPTGGIDDAVVPAPLEEPDALAGDDPAGVRDVLGGVGGGHELIKHHSVTDVNTSDEENPPTLLDRLLQLADPRYGLARGFDDAQATINEAAKAVQENMALRAWVERHLAAHPEELGFT